jgi:hypothetical protein
MTGPNALRLVLGFLFGALIGVGILMLMFLR